MPKNIKKKRGGGNPPVDIKSNISPLKQWSNPFTSAPEPSYNGGLYKGPRFNGPWGNIPVTPTTTNMINNNLKSADPPPGATTQYPGTNRPGNNFIAMPGVNWYNNTTQSNPGGFRLKCTQGGAKSKKKKVSQKKLSKKKINKKKLSKNNKKKLSKNNKKNRTKGKKHKGGLALYSSNMDCNAPFHPIWNKSYNPKVAATSRPNMNTYTFIQDGGSQNESADIIYPESNMNPHYAKSGLNSEARNEYREQLFYDLKSQDDMEMTPEKATEIYNENKDLFGDEEELMELWQEYLDNQSGGYPYESADIIYPESDMNPHYAKSGLNSEARNEYREQLFYDLKSQDDMEMTPEKATEIYNENKDLFGDEEELMELWQEYLDMIN